MEKMQEVEDKVEAIRKGIGKGLTEDEKELQKAERKFSTNVTNWVHNEE